MCSQRYRRSGISKFRRVFHVNFWNDSAKVVDYAGRRGIRHGQSLHSSHGGLAGVSIDFWRRFVCLCKPGYPSWGAGLTVDGTASGNLDPTNEEMWKGVSAMFAELATLFPDESIHVGFDEVTLSGCRFFFLLSFSFFFLSFFFFFPLLNH